MIKTVEAGYEKDYYLYLIDYFQIVVPNDLVISFLDIDAH